MEVECLTQIAGDGGKEKNIYGEDNVYTEFAGLCKIRLQSHIPDIETYIYKKRYEHDAQI